MLIFKEKKAKDPKVKVSLVVAAHNELQNLRNLIPHLLEQKYQDFEIILVDDRSTDGSAEMVRQDFATADHLKLLEIKETNPVFAPKKYALTEGIRMAQGEVILLTDADCVPRSRYWVREMTRGFSDEQIQIVIGYSPYFRQKNGLNTFIRFETLYTGIQYISLALLGRPYMAVGRNMAFRKNLFTENQGYESHKHINGGDDDLFIQETATFDNTSIVIDTKAHTVSVPKDTYSDYYRQKRRHLSVGDRYRFADRLILGMLNVSHLLYIVSFFYLLIIKNEITISIIGLGLRTAVITTIFTLISKKLKERTKWYWIPVLDVLYILNYTLIGITATVSKKTTWK